MFYEIDLMCLGFVECFVPLGVGALNLMYGLVVDLCGIIFHTNQVSCLGGYDYEFGAIVMAAAGGVLPAPVEIPAQVKLSNGNSKPAFYVLVLTCWGYVPYQLSSKRLCQAFVTSMSMANLVCMLVPQNEVASKLAQLNTESNLTMELGFYYGSGKVVCNNLAAINSMLPQTCAKLEFNSMPVQLPEPVLANRIKASLVSSKVKV